MRLKDLSLGLGLAAGALAGFLFLAELALQVGQLLVRPRVTKLDPILGWYHTPGAGTQGAVEGHPLKVSYNRLGYRNPEHSLAREPGRKRVVFLGDSFTEGGGVGDEEVFTWLLEKRVAATDMINLGVYGYNTVQEYLTLRDLGVKFSPDAAVLVVFTNDIPGNVWGLESFGPAPRFMLDGDSLRFEGLDDPHAHEAYRASNIPAPEWIHQHSLVYYALNHYVYQRLAARRIRGFYDRRLAEVPTPERTELFRRIVRRMQSLCDDRGIRFLVVFAFSEYDLRGKSPMGAEIDSVRADGTQVFDMFQPLHEAQSGGGQTLYYKQDIHWNALGHRVVADLLEPVIKNLLADSSGTGVKGHQRAPRTGSPG